MNMPSYTIWGTVNADGTIQAGSSSNFTVSMVQSGVYNITFIPPFVNRPSIVGSQCQFDEAGNFNENTLDNVIFPEVHGDQAYAITGDNNGTYGNRTFSFIAMGSMSVEAAPKI